MVLVTPAFLLIFALGIVPVVCVIVFSLGKVQPALLTWSYMGLDNYAEVLKRQFFLVVTRDHPVFYGGFRTASAGDWLIFSLQRFFSAGHWSIMPTAVSKH